MKTIEVKGYDIHIPPVTLVVDKIVAISPYHRHLGKTAIWVVGQEDEFITDEDYDTIISRLKLVSGSRE